MKLRTQNGQSLVEYAIGIGCVMSVCMIVLGGLGGAAEDVTRAVLVNINDAKAQAPDPTAGTNAGIFTNSFGGSTPWVLH